VGGVKKLLEKFCVFEHQIKTFVPHHRRSGYIPDELQFPNPCMEALEKGELASANIFASSLNSQRDSHRWSTLWSAYLSKYPIMAPSLLRPQAQLSPAEALQLAQQAPTILRSNPKAFSSSPLSFLFSSSETPELWMIYENLLLACLRTGDDRSAHEFLERLVLRFGDDNQRIMAMKGLVREAEAANNGELETVLKEYDEILAAVGDGGTNIVS
jgi:hypothetical protein